MKIIIILDAKQGLDTNYQYIIPNQLNTIENNSCEELHITCIDFISQNLQFIQECINKLRKNGILTIIGYDIIEVSKAIINGRLTIEEANNIIYQNKQSMDNLFRLKMFLALNMTLDDIRINGLTYNIKAIKK